MKLFLMLYVLIGNIKKTRFERPFAIFWEENTKIFENWRRKITIKTQNFKTNIYRSRNLQALFSFRKSFLVPSIMPLRPEKASSCMESPVL